MPSKAEERWKRLVALLSRPPEVPPRTTRGVGGEAVLRPVRTPSASRCSLGAAPLAFAVSSTPTRVCTRLSLGSLSQRVHPSQREQGDAGGNSESPVEWPVLFTCHSNPEKPPYACQTATRHLSR